MNIAASRESLFVSVVFLSTMTAPPTSAAPPLQLTTCDNLSELNLRVSVNLLSRTVNVTEQYARLTVVDQSRATVFDNSIRSRGVV